MRRNLISILLVFVATTLVCLRVSSEPLSPAPPPSPPSVSKLSEACQSDADCGVTNFAGCCACPQCSKGPPRAVNLNSLQDEQKRCVKMKCDETICGIAGMCPPGEDASHFSALCRNGACVLKKR